MKHPKRLRPGYFKLANILVLLHEHCKCVSSCSLLRAQIEQILPVAFRDKGIDDSRTCVSFCGGVGTFAIVRAHVKAAEKKIAQAMYDVELAADTGG